MSQQFFPPKQEREAPHPSREGNARSQMNTEDRGGGRKPHGWVGEKGTDTVRPPEGASPDQAYVVMTPNPNFNGITAHVAFTGGRALVWDAAVAKQLRDDFHYSVSPDPEVPIVVEDEHPRGDLDLINEPRIGTSGQTAMNVGVLERPKAMPDLGFDGPDAGDSEHKNFRDLGFDKDKE